MKTKIFLLAIVCLSMSVNSERTAFAADENSEDDLELKTEFSEMAKKVPKNYEIVKIAPLYGVEGFASKYKIKFGIPLAIDNACHKKLGGVKIAKKEFTIKHKSKAEPNEPNAFVLSRTILILPKLPRDLKNAVVSEGGAEGGCFKRAGESSPSVWSDYLQVSEIDEGGSYFIAVPEGVKVRIVAVTDVKNDVIKMNKDGSISYPKANDLN